VLSVIKMNVGAENASVLVAENVRGFYDV